MQALKQYWIFPAIGAVIALALGLGARGAWVQDYHVVTVAIFLAFFVTGLTLDTSGLSPRELQPGAAIAAMASSLALIPLLAWAMSSRLFPLEITVGVCIIATAPVSVVSGTVMTAIGRGNIPLSILICVLGNSIGIFIIPFALQLLLGTTGEIELPVLKLLASLVLTVLMPIVLGKLARPALGFLIRRHQKAFGVFQQCIILLIVFNAFTGSATKIGAAGATLPTLLPFMVGLHVCILLMNFGISRLLRLDRPSVTAFTIHTSQKTLTVSYVVWFGGFAAQYPLALIPGIIYHLTQIVMDTFVAEWFRKLSTPADSHPRPSKV